jgi:predicted dehydrogenase
MSAPPRVPRLGFLGTGWIGRHRMRAIVEAGAAEAACIADPSPDMAQAALGDAPGARLVPDLDAMLAQDIDAVVIATPSARHAAQTIACLEAGKAVFCQKPLGRTEAEVRRAVDTAREAGLLLGVDLSYRHTRGMAQIRELAGSGALGRIFAADLVFHNAYGPDKPWFYDPALSGGGCVMDLGVHLVDLALWVLGAREVAGVSSRLHAGGRPITDPHTQVEDHAVATVDLADGAVVRIACSWRLQAGQEAEIAASFYGTEGGTSFRNVGGSFYDFNAALHRGTTREPLAEPPDEWGGRAAVAWARALAEGRGFDPEAESLVTVARVLDRIYGRG